MTNTYEKAYTEVLEILKYLPTKEYSKIPKEKIEFYEKHKAKDYTYVFDITKSINEQKITREANAIIVSLFRDYFATPEQKEKLKKILLNNEQKHQEELKEKYKTDNIFNKKEKTTDEVENNTQIVELKEEPWYKRIIKNILSFFRVK